MTKKLLSIAIPTLDRAEYLKFTLIGKNKVCRFSHSHVEWTVVLNYPLAA